MKNTTIALRRIAITTGLLLGSFALAAMAGSWSAPGSTPPNGNVDAPINVGGSFQEKLGALMVHGLSINGGFMFNPGGSISAGQVLTAKDNIGTVGWGSIIGSSATPCANGQVPKASNVDGKWVWVCSDDSTTGGGGTTGANGISVIGTDLLSPSCPSEYPNKVYTSKINDIAGTHPDDRGSAVRTIYLINCTR